MNPLLILKGIELLNTVIEKNTDEDMNGLEWRKEAVVEAIFQGIDEARPFWARKTFWATVVAVVIPIVNRVAGLDMQIEEVSVAITPLVAFILGESWRKKNG